MSNQHFTNIGAELGQLQLERDRCRGERGGRGGQGGRGGARGRPIGGGRSGQGGEAVLDRQGEAARSCGLPSALAPE